MDQKAMKQMAKMVDAVQPFCDETITAAMTCSHAGSMGLLLGTKLLLGIDWSLKTSALPNPVFIAVGSETIYAFKYAPRGFRFKIKKEVARWPKAQVHLKAEMSSTMATFVMTTDSGENYAFEVPIMMGGKELAEMFLEALGATHV